MGKVQGRITLLDARVVRAIRRHCITHRHIYFIVTKKSGGLRPILDLQVLNRALHNLAFKMLTQKRIFGSVRPLDWFAAINLKHAYFHVQCDFMFQCDSHSRVGHISTRSCPSGCPCRLASSPKS